MKMSMENKRLEVLLAEAGKKVAAMSDEERAAMYDAQRLSWVTGEAETGETSSIKQPSLKVTGFWGNPLRVVLSNGQSATITQKLIDTFCSPSPLDGSEPDYAIWSNEHRGWWAPNKFGYVQSPFQAGKYTRAEALDICRNANIGCGLFETPNEIPVRYEDILVIRPYRTE
jgi:hypothetical protein